ncbi:MAG: potassium transporter TrkG, partial [Pseudomonadota bacterium]
MSFFDAVVHAMTTIATGGFSNYDSSFATFSGPVEYAASVFMILAALPFVRYVQLANGNTNSLWQDSQTKAFLTTIFVLVVVMAIFLMSVFPHQLEQAFRESLFNITSIISGTGYASVDYMTWGSFPVMLFFLIGLIGGCAGSTACSIKVFRYQLLFASIKTQIRRIRSPHGVFMPLYDGRPVSRDVLTSVMSFFMFFVLSMGVLSWALALTGLDFITSVSGAATALANVGPGLGSQIGPAGNFGGLNDTAKWLLSLGMLVGRLELLAVYAIFTVQFWRS